MLIWTQSEQQHFMRWYNDPRLYTYNPILLAIYENLKASFPTWGGWCDYWTNSAVRIYVTTAAGKHVSLYLLLTNLQLTLDVSVIGPTIATFSISDPELHVKLVKLIHDHYCL